MRKLLVDQRLQHAAGEHGAVRPRQNPARPRAPAVPALRLLHGHRRRTRGSGQFNALQLELHAALARAGWRCNVGLHAGALRQQRARHRQQHHRRRAVRSLRHREGSRSRSERRQAPVRRERDLGRAGRPRPQARRRTCRGGPNALFGGWTVSTLFQARSGQHLTPFFSGFYTTSPWNTGKPLDGLGNVFCCAWRPDQIGDPNTGGSRDAFFDQTRLRASRRRASSATPRRAACTARAPGS